MWANTHKNACSQRPFFTSITPWWIEVYCFFLSITKVMTMTVAMTTPPTISPIIAPLLDPTSSAKNTCIEKNENYYERSGARPTWITWWCVCVCRVALKWFSYQFLMVNFITSTLPLFSLHPHFWHLLWLQGRYWYKRYRVCNKNRHLVVK